MEVPKEPPSTELILFGESLLIETGAFIAVSFLFFLAYGISSATGDKDEWVHLRRYLDVCKFFLPAITRSLFQALSCAEYDAGDKGTVRVLFVDHAVDCDSASYEPLRIYASIMIALLPVGFLLGSLVGLWRAPAPACAGNGRTSSWRWWISSPPPVS